MRAGADQPVPHLDDPVRARCDIPIVRDAFIIDDGHVETRMTGGDHVPPPGS
jgi:hypothetical protein